jgi:hypothetical protein
MGDSLRHSGEQGYVLANAFHNFLFGQYDTEYNPCYCKKK